jgi:hypothetical protein
MTPMASRRASASKRSKFSNFDLGEVEVDSYLSGCGNYQVLKRLVDVAIGQRAFLPKS